MAMDFRAATDLLSPCITQEAIAEAADVHPDSIRRARYPKGHVHHRAPPRNWAQLLARLARHRAEELNAVADQLEEQPRE
jgi:hypothetical protein